jgi:hypothetical protein
MSRHDRLYLDDMIGVRETIGLGEGFRPGGTRGGLVRYDAVLRNALAWPHRPLSR